MHRKLEFMMKITLQPERMCKMMPFPSHFSKVT